MIAIGNNGVLYKVKFFKDSFFDWEVQNKACPLGDDLWNSAHLINNNIPIYIVPSGSILNKEIFIPEKFRLWNKNKFGNDEQLKELQKLGYFYPKSRIYSIFFSRSDNFVFQSILNSLWKISSILRKNIPMYSILLDKFKKRLSS